MSRVEDKVDLLGRGGHFKAWARRLRRSSDPSVMAPVKVLEPERYLNAHARRRSANFEEIRRDAISRYPKTLANLHGG